MLIKVISISNISHQLVTLLYSKINPAKNVTDLPASKAGTLQLQSGNNIDVESARLDRNQLNSLRSNNLISYTERNVSTTTASSTASHTEASVGAGLGSSGSDNAIQDPNGSISGTGDTPIASE